MKFSFCFGLLLTLGCLQCAMAQDDNIMWICREDTQEVQYFTLSLADTFPDNRDTFTMVDTGDKYEGKYVNFDYQFASPADTIINTVTHDTTVRHPGYAGYKFYWDGGQASFWVHAFDSMIVWHKGPLQGHKVKMIWAQGSAGCGTPINYELIGEFKSSAAWKRESIPFPAKRNYITAPDSPFVKDGLFELRMLIYNDSSVTTSPTSAKGNLKIDNMCFIKKGTGIRNADRAPEGVGGPGYFVPKVSGKVTLAIFSLQGEQLFKEPVAVTAGKRYNVGGFARKNSNLPAKWIHCVQISGAGVNITAKLFH
jgi:hypothetical protein